MEKKILDIASFGEIDELGEEMLSRIRTFDLEKFFTGQNKTGKDNKDVSRKAVGIITEDGIFIGDAFIDRGVNSETLDRYPHKETARVLHRLFADQSIDRPLLRDDNSEMPWNQVMVNDGVILLQLSVMEKDTDASEIWVPSVVSDELLEQLKNFNMILKEVVSKNHDLVIRFYLKVGTQLDGAEADCVVEFNDSSNKVDGIDKLIDTIKEKSQLLDNTSSIKK